jgi:hypothetical protein
MLREYRDNIEHSHDGIMASVLAAVNDAKLPISPITLRAFADR